MIFLLIVRALDLNQHKYLDADNRYGYIYSDIPRTAEQRLTELESSHEISSYNIIFNGLLFRGTSELLCLVRKMLNNINFFLSEGFSKGWREAFISGDQEPWVFRGGLTAELQRLIPVDASNDLFVYKTPEAPLTTHYVIRPYMEADRSKLYDLVMKTADDGKDATALYSAYPQLKGDLVLGCYLENLSDVTLMVVEDESENLIGYCVADPNSRGYLEKFTSYLEKLREKYPKITAEEGSMLSPCEELLSSLSCEPEALPESLIAAHPASIIVGVLHTVLDDSLTKRLLTCVLASLRAQGTFSGHVTVKAGEKNTLDLYNRLGFREVATRGAHLYLGRAF